MLRVASALMLLAVVLAGCADEASPEPVASADLGADAPAASDRPTMTVTGVVQDEDNAPLAGATVTLLSQNRSQTTGPDGAFSFEDVPVGFHVLRADAPDHQLAELTARPAGDGGSTSLVFALQRFAEEPYTQSVQYQGIVQCAMEVLIITPSCDSAVEYANGPSVTEDTTNFDLALDPNWRTVVLDLDYDPGSQPGFEGMRITVRAVNDDDELGSYEEYGQFQGPDDLNARLEPGAVLEEGNPPLPANSTSLRFEVFPQGHGWHAVCSPGDEATCFLGAGAGLDVSFDLYATTFYVQGAPDGWSHLA